MNKITRVYGTCDSWQVELEDTGGGYWTCSIPADMVDGQYACTLYAVDEEGDIGLWCGMLYLSSGKVCLELENDPIGFSLVHESVGFEIVDESLSFAQVEETLSFVAEEETLTFSVVKECDCCE